ncbi:hypothetical protein [Nonomuraea sp. B12E4]|uniref:hypothetical protein n=1 Tax=Nonomuraea sp. B12E4 TaxID=3153564 RepID=UPI00325FA141
MAAGPRIGTAAELIDRVERVARTASHDALGTAARELAEAGHEVLGVALCLGAAGSARMTLPDDLAEALAEQHSAEGELYREALMEAARDSGLAAKPLRLQGPPRHGCPCARPGRGQPVDELRTEGRSPWTRDHKEATPAALLVLDSDGE